MSQTDVRSRDQSVKKAKLDSTTSPSAQASSSAARASESGTLKVTTSSTGTATVPKWFKPLGPKK